MFGNYFKNRKWRAIAFGEVNVDWQGGNFTVFSVIFFENDNDDRKWKVSGGTDTQCFHNTSHYAPCETWKHTGLLPEWAKDPMAEKLMR